MERYKSSNAHRGHVLIETLIATVIMTSVGLAMSMSVILSIQSVSISRSGVSIISELNGLIEQYRREPFHMLSSRIKPIPSAIKDGDSVSIKTRANQNRSSITSTFTAVKKVKGGSPEAIAVRVIGVLEGDGTPDKRTITFETLVADLGV